MTDKEPRIHWSFKKPAWSDKAMLIVYEDDKILGEIRIGRDYAIEAVSRFINSFDIKKEELIKGIGLGGIT